MQIITKRDGIPSLYDLIDVGMYVMFQLFQSLFRVEPDDLFDQDLFFFRTMGLVQMLGIDKDMNET